MDTEQTPASQTSETTSQPKKSSAWKIWLLILGGLASYGIVSASLQAPEPASQNTQAQVQRSNTESQVQNQAPEIKKETPVPTSTTQKPAIPAQAPKKTSSPVPANEPAPAQTEQQVSIPTPESEPTPVVNQYQPPPTPNPTPEPSTAPDPGYAPNGTYTNTYGNEVPSPYEAPTKPAGASALCNDGTYSFSQSRRGTCSHHGGVAEWY